MKYNNIEIGIPTIEHVVDCTTKYGYKYSAYDCYAWLKNKEFKTKKGEEFYSLEFACTVYNSVFIYKNQKQKQKNIKENINKIEYVYENSPYKEQLLDKRWRLYRDFAIFTRGGVCEICGSRKNLVIHHPQYKNGYNAWDYSVKDVVCLCNTCHKKIHNIKH